LSGYRQVWIGVLPNEHTNVIGLSRYTLVWLSGSWGAPDSGRSVVQLADLIMEKT
jgi:GTP cyclohydrolase I